MLNSLRIFTVSSRRIYSDSIVFFSKKRVSFLNFVKCFSFCQSNEDSKLTIQDKEEKAIIAYYTLKCIKQFEKKQLLSDSRSLRQKIFNFQHLTKSILSRAKNFQSMNKASNQPQQTKIDLSKYDFKQANIQEVMKGYNVQEGASIDLKVWITDSLSTNGKMLLFPNFGTSKIFQKIDKQNDKIIISGDKGIGKSFAYFNYAYLSDFIIDYRLALIKQQSSYSFKFLHFVDVEEFQKVKKLFYFSMKDIDNIRKLEARFQLQAYLPNNFNLNGSGLYDDDPIQKIREYLKSIHGYYYNKKINTVCVADESNVYFDILQPRNNDFIKNEVYNHSDTLKCVDKIFGLLIYNSSQAVQTQWLHFRIEQINFKKQKKLHDPYEDDKLSNKDLHIHHRQYLSTKQGHIYVYSLLWDELCKQLTKYNLESNKQARFIFEKLFGLPSSLSETLPKNSSQLDNAFKWWNIDVRPLNINIVCNNYKHLTLLKQGLIKLPRQQNKQKATMSLLLGFNKLKQLIQKNCQEIYISKIKDYYLRSQNEKQKAFLFAFMHKLSQIKNKIVVQNQSSAIIVDIEQLLSQFRNNYNYQYHFQLDSICDFLGTVYSISQEFQINQSNIERIKKQMEDMNNNVQIPKQLQIFKKKKLKFLLSQSCLASITIQVSANLQETLMLTKNIISGGLIQPIISGLLMNMLYYQLFQSSNNWYLCIRKLNGNDYNVFEISQTIPFQVKKQLNLTYQLKNIFEYANKHKGKYVLGFQANILTEQECIIKNKYNEFNHRNPIFDFIIVKEKQQQFYINTFDVAIGSVQAKVNQFKLQKQYNKLLQQIESIFALYQKKVIWEHQILGFKEHINSFKMIDHKTAHSLMFKRRLVNHQLMSSEGMNRIQNDVGELKLGVCSAYDKHFILNSWETNRGISIFTEMKNIENQSIRIKENIEQL